MTAKTILRSLLQQHRVLLIFVGLMVLFRGAVADWNPVPTGSMKPTIVEGDVILINKLVYGLRVPLAGASIYPYSGPERGDIVVFESARAKKRLVKRVIGLPGDIVAIKNNRLIINAQATHYREVGLAEDGMLFEESFSGSRHLVTLNISSLLRANYGPVVVPDDHYFVLGDTRANSADSRVYGFVPRNEIVGRVRRVLASFDMDDHYLPRSKRVLTLLDP
jgi:signal peptidase I